MWEGPHLTTERSAQETLAQRRGQKEQDQGNPHPNGEAGKILTFSFFGFRFGQWRLAAPTKLFIFWIPLAAIRTIHKCFLLAWFR